MPDHYGIFEQGFREIEEFEKTRKKGLYSIRQTTMALKKYAKEGIDIQDNQVRKALEDTGINDDESKVRRMYVAKRGKRMIVLTREGEKSVFRYFREAKDCLVECTEKEYLEKLDFISKLAKL